VSGTLGEFLRNRRARLRPSDVGLPAGTGRRQTPGLRREELATLAGVSVDYYARLEQGRDTNPGTAVLDALASALRLAAEERAHLYRLAAGRSRSVPTKHVVRQGLRLLLESVRPTPAWVLDRIGTVLATNAEGARLVPGIEDWPPARRNITRYVFTHPNARTVFVSWDRVAEACVADLRSGPGDDGLIAELSAASDEFAALWRRYDVRANRGGERAFYDPAVGHFELTTQILTGTDGLRFVAFQAAPGSPGHEAVVLLSLAVSA
jgi:transcriptional regulator with XRE-family HTH domain